MSKQPQELGEIKKFDQAIEHAYQSLIRLARVEWEHRFSGKDPSDECVSVRIRPAGQKTAFRSRSEFPGANADQVVHPGTKLPSRASLAKRRASRLSA